MPASYRNGKIYKLVNTANDILYVGSTAQSYLCSRMTAHRRDAARLTSPIYSAMSEIGADKFKIVLIKLFPCNNRRELEAEEYLIMNANIAAGVKLYNASINGKHSDAVKAKIAAAKRAANLTGERNALFKFGSLLCVKNQWKFLWEDLTANKRVGRSFSIDKWGYWAAKKKAEAVRQQVYPRWQKDPEQVVIDEFMALEI